MDKQSSKNSFLKETLPRRKYQALAKVGSNQNSRLEPAGEQTGSTAVLSYSALPCDPKRTPLSADPTERHSCAHENIGTDMFTVPQFLTGKTRNAPNPCQQKNG